MIRSSVLLPEPDGPSKATSSPAGTENVTRLTAWKVPNRFARFSTRMAIAMISSIGMFGSRAPPRHFSNPSRAASRERMRSMPTKSPNETAASTRLAA